MQLHHIGYVVADIDRYEKNLLFKRKIGDVTDPLQKARLSLYETWSDTLIELIAPESEEAFTFAFLKKNGGGYHHLCYKVSDVHEMNEIAGKHNLLMFKGPLPAPLFNGLPVYFFFDRNKSITEFLIEPDTKLP